MDFLKNKGVNVQDDSKERIINQGNLIINNNSKIKNQSIENQKMIQKNNYKNMNKLEDEKSITNERLHIYSIPPTTINIKAEMNTTDDNSGLKKEVFIVHGHDNEAKERTARFIEKLGLEAIILHEQTSSSMTIIEKIENYSNVGFGIVLYTPCDIGGKQKDSQKNFKSRARQNVVFEHGYLMGKIGRENVCALVKGQIEIPNDISGIVYAEMDNNDAWKFSLAKELKKSGYEIDLNKLG